jgi:hypothetical protein
VDAQNFAKNLLYVAVRQFAQRAQRLSRIAARLKLSPDALSFGVGLWAEHG